MGDLMTCPSICAGAADAAGGTGEGAGAVRVMGAAGTAWAGAGAGTIMGAAGAALTMRTLPSASVISSSETFDSETRSMSVLSLRRSMVTPYDAPNMR